MARAERMYRRLPGRHAGLVGYSRLWLGPDHLLLARTTAFSEEYKRFYFRDIQAIITRRTARREILNIILILTAIVFGALAVFTNGGWSVFSVGMTGTLMVASLVNWLRGPSCVCHVRTAVHIEELSPLKRFRAVGKVIDRLRPKIETAQGLLAPEMLRPKPPSVFAAPPTETAAQSASRAPPSTEIIP